MREAWNDDGRRCRTQLADGTWGTCHCGYLLRCANPKDFDENGKEIGPAPVVLPDWQTGHHE